MAPQGVLAPPLLLLFRLAIRLPDRLLLSRIPISQHLQAMRTTPLGLPLVRNLCRKKSLDNATYWKPGHCIPKADATPQYEIKSKCLSGHVQYMKDHAIIGKFLWTWPTERDLLVWINSRWKPTCHIDIKLGSKGFFTVSFENEKEREHIFEGGPYFFCSAGLHLRYWKDNFNPDNKDFSFAPVWVRLYSLPFEHWEEEILAGIGNTLGNVARAWSGAGVLRSIYLIYIYILSLY